MAATNFFTQLESSRFLSLKGVHNQHIKSNILMTLVVNGRTYFQFLNILLFVLFNSRLFGVALDPNNNIVILFASIQDARGATTLWIS